MQLAFYAKPGHVCHWPGPKSRGVPVLYVGRKSVRVDNNTLSHPVADEPVSVDADSDAGRRFAKLCKRDGALWPADEQTARFCGVPFVAVEKRDGEWQPVSPKPAKSGKGN